VGRDDAKPCTLVDDPGPLVERGDVEEDASRPVARVRELETGAEELGPSPLPCQVGPQTEAVVEVRRLSSK
jgi:hypothetical protein